jgi:hypothetical protein
MSRRGILAALEVPVKLDAKPGVATPGIRRQESFDLMPGTRMTWITWTTRRNERWASEREDMVR